MAHLPVIRFSCSTHILPGEQKMNRLFLCAFCFAVAIAITRLCLEQALPEKSISHRFASASPPDVRRGYAAPFNLELILGFALGSALGLKNRAKPERRAQPIRRLKRTGA